jgi:hypothetical protein
VLVLTVDGLAAFLAELLVEMLPGFARVSSQAARVNEPLRWEEGNQTLLVSGLCPLRAEHPRAKAKA